MTRDAERDPLLTCEECGKAFPRRSRNGRKPRWCSRRCQRGRRTRPTAEQRLWARVSRRGSAECWPWRGSTSSSGYGVISRDNVAVYAHRLSYELLVGPIPEGLQIDHLCRNRRCVNPRHLEVVTSAVNTQRGGSARLTAELVREMRASGLGPCAVARKYGINTGHASRILSGRMWKNAGSVPK